MCDTYDAVDAMWAVFDLTADARISRQEFNARNSGLADTLIATLQFDS